MPLITSSLVSSCRSVSNVRSSRSIRSRAGRIFVSSARVLGLIARLTMGRGASIRGIFTVARPSVIVSPALKVSTLGTIATSPVTSAPSGSSCLPCGRWKSPTRSVAPVSMLVRVPCPAVEPASTRM